MRRLYFVRTSLAVLLLIVSGAAQSSVETADQVEKRFALANGAQVRVENPLGGIEITGYAGKEAVVNIEKRYGNSNDAKREWIKNARVHLDGTGNSLRVRVEFDNCWRCDGGSWSFSTRPGVFIRLKVPKQVNVDVNHDRGNVQITQINGEVKIESDRSPVVVEDVSGALIIHVDRGNVNVRDLDLTGPLRVQADRGDVNIAVTSVKSNVEVAADRGDVTLQLPRGTGMTLDVARTRRSRFRSDFPLSISGDIGEDFRSTVNGGGIQVRLRHDRGQLRLVEGATAL